MEMAFSWLGFVDFVRDVAFQIRFGVIAVLSGDNGGDFHGGMGEFPMTSLASGHVLETRFPEVFEKIAGFSVAHAELHPKWAVWQSDSLRNLIKEPGM
jgi:hypothetical protein